MKYKKILSIAAAALLISLVSIDGAEVFAVPKDGDILIQSIHGERDGIFSRKDGLWQPGMRKSSEFVIKNNSSDNIECKELNIRDNLLKDGIDYVELVENTNVTISDDGVVIYTGSFKDTFNNRKIKLNDNTIIKHGEEKVLQMDIETLSSMSNLANNSMNIGLDFSLGVTYELAEESSEENSEENSGSNSNNGSSNNGSSNIPATGDRVGSLSKIGAGIGMLLAGALIINKPRRKEIGAND